MLISQNCKFFFVAVLASIISLNSCSNCKKPTNPDNNKITQSFQGEQDTPINELEQNPEIPVKNRGIPNIGNSCYMSAAIQILASFYKDLFFKKQESELARTATGIIDAITGQKELSSDELRERVKNFYQALEKPLNSDPNKGGIAWINKNNRQEDADELLTLILGKLDLPNAHTINKYIHPITKEEQIVVGKDPWYIWKMGIPKTGEKTMQELFDNSLRPAMVDRRWSGSQNPGTEPSILQEQIPLLQGLNNLYRKMFIISLNRFDYEKEEGEEEGKATKIETNTEDPFNLVIKKEQTTDLAHDLRYELVGFIQHHGNVGGGHYVAYTKVGSQWMYYSDKTVEEAPIAKAHDAAKQAYLFFYQQVKS